MAYQEESLSYHCSERHWDVHCSAAGKHHYQMCRSNPGHKNFMTVSELREKKPSDLGLSESQMTELYNNCDRTTRVEVRYTSEARPDVFPVTDQPYPMISLKGKTNQLRYGTGFLCQRLDIGGEELGISDEELDIDLGKPCPCMQCRSSFPHGESGNHNIEIHQQERFYFVILTATHFVFDKSEAQESTFDFFYDSEDSTNVRKLYGVTVLGDKRDRVDTDRSFVVCVTHDGKLARLLSGLCVPTVGFPIGIMVSHPHGISKRISIGKILGHKCILVSKKKMIKLPNGTRVRFSRDRDAMYMLKCINRRFTHRKPVLASISGDGSSVLETLVELGVYCQEGFRPESDVVLEGETVIRNPKKQWWKLPSGVTLISECGKKYRLPLSVEVFVNGGAFYKGSEDVHNKEDDNKGLFDEILGPVENEGSYFYSTYNIPACPGSSGAMVHSSEHQHLTKGSLGVVHFGAMRDWRSSGLNTLDHVVFS